jgi:hypothetical protein
LSKNGREEKKIVKASYHLMLIFYKYIFEKRVGRERDMYARGVSRENRIKNLKIKSKNRLKNIPCAVAFYCFFRKRKKKSKYFYIG